MCNSIAKKSFKNVKEFNKNIYIFHIEIIELWNYGGTFKVQKQSRQYVQNRVSIII
jgi:hypothetical protein